ncbi:MAG: glycosyltransferase [Planctomycetaceae bacterium]|jgi:glycosyltransferase involved in cell wall biosynthesis|nr:glycosyltransferase [Planctomycetaceae bacterium]
MTNAINSDKRILLIVPMRNEEKFVAQCLDSLLSQIDAFPNAVLVCVDGSSADRTQKIIAQYQVKYQQIVLINNPDAIKPIGNNLAIKNYETEIDAYFILDCHSQYASNYISSCLEVLDCTDADVVGGYWQIEPGIPCLIGRIIAATTSHRFGMAATYRRKHRLPECESDCVPFGCFRGDFFKKFGYFDERLVRNEDSELFSRVKRHGGKIILSPKIIVTYFCRSTFRGIIQNCMVNGKWNIYSTWISGYGLQFRHFVPLFFVLSLIGLPILSTIFQPVLWLWLVMVCLYCLLAFVSSIQACEKQYQYIPLFCFTFFMIHISYGIGSLIGILTLPIFATKSTEERQRPLADRIP